LGFNTQYIIFLFLKLKVFGIEMKPTVRMIESNSEFRKIRVQHCTAISVGSIIPTNQRPHFDSILNLQLKVSLEPVLIEWNER